MSWTNLNEPAAACPSRAGAPATGASPDEETPVRVQRAFHTSCLRPETAEATRLAVVMGAPPATLADLTGPAQPG
ncbi:hypothetical protein AB0F77_20535 [Streptomyces sp. NPDC026672]|uniref:hypothetical protein n=1 Tax=unclassified Streptomyces TaxID=2593676 RepID=UPI0034057A4B